MNIRKLHNRFQRRVGHSKALDQKTSEQAYSSLTHYQTLYGSIGELVRIDAKKEDDIQILADYKALLNNIYQLLDKARYFSVQRNYFLIGQFETTPTQGVFLLLKPLIRAIKELAEMNVKYTVLKDKTSLRIDDQFKLYWNEYKAAHEIISDKTNHIDKGVKEVLNELIANIYAEYCKVVPGIEPWSNERTLSKTFRQ